MQYERHLVTIDTEYFLNIPPYIKTLDVITDLMNFIATHGLYSHVRSWELTRVEPSYRGPSDEKRATVRTHYVVTEKHADVAVHKATEHLTKSHMQRAIPVPHFSVHEVNGISTPKPPDMRPAALHT